MKEIRNGSIIYDGIKFSLHRKHYESTNFINGKRISLHLYIWEKYNGAIPKNCLIHHIDRNPLNNDISNLQMMTKNEHIALHHMDGCITKQTERAKRKISQSLKKRYKIHPHHSIGSKASAETKLKLSIARRKYLDRLSTKNCL